MSRYAHIDFFVSSLAPAPVCAPGKTGRSVSVGRPDRGCTRWESPSRGEKVCGRRVVRKGWSRSFAKAAGRQTLRRPGAAMWCVGRSRRRAPARAIRWSSVRAPAKNMISGFGWLKAPISGYTDCEFIASDTDRTPSPRREPNNKLNQKNNKHHCTSCRSKSTASGSARGSDHAHSSSAACIQ